MKIRFIFFIFMFILLSCIGFADDVDLLLSAKWIDVALSMEIGTTKDMFLFDEQEMIVIGHTKIDGVERLFLIANDDLVVDTIIPTVLYFIKHYHLEQVSSDNDIVLLSNDDISVSISVIREKKSIFVLLVEIK